MTKSITSQLSDNAIYQILEIIASEIDDFEHCQHYEEVEYCDGYEYKVGKLLETTDEKWLT